MEPVYRRGVWRRDVRQRHAQVRQSPVLTRMRDATGSCRSVQESAGECRRVWESTTQSAGTLKISQDVCRSSKPVQEWQKEGSRERG